MVKKTSIFGGPPEIEVRRIAGKRNSLNEVCERYTKKTKEDNMPNNKDKGHQELSYFQNELKIARGEEKRNDVTLVGSDGSRVSAVRFLLAARSEVFGKMLYGDFKEGSSKEITMNYEEEVLQVIVDYSFGETIQYEFTEDPKSAHTFVQIFDCAHFLGMTRLEQGTIKILNDYCTKTKKHPLRSLCVIYDDATNNPAAGELMKISLKHLSSDMVTLKDGVSSLGRKALEQIVCDPRIDAKEIELFNLVREWLSVSPVEESRISSAKDCITKCINISKIHPSDLIASVKESNLVPERMLLTAFSEQALHAKELESDVGKSRRECGGAFIQMGAVVKHVNGEYRDDPVDHQPYQLWASPNEPNS